MTPRKQYLLRVDQNLWEEIEHWAADDLRSVNAQVEYILRDAVKKRRGISLDASSDDKKGEH
jgi:hypothetical protein